MVDGSPPVRDSTRCTTPQFPHPHHNDTHAHTHTQASAAALALDLAERELILESSPSSFNNKTPPQYALRLRLPYPVCVGRESASFSRKRAELTVTLPVCPPPAPSPPATEEAAETNANAGDALRSAAREEPGQQQEQQQRPPAADVNPHARWVEREGGVGDRLVLDPKAQQAPAQGATQREEQQQRKEEEAAVLASSYVTPAYQVQQRPGCFSLIVDAPGVDPGSVEAAWANDDGAAGGTGATMTLAFHGGGGSAEERRHCYRLRLRLWGRVDPQGCRVDVASRNVLVVVRKAKEKEAGAGWWPRFEAEDKGAAGGGGGKREAGAPLKPALENSHVFELAE